MALENRQVEWFRQQFQGLIGSLRPTEEPDLTTLKAVVMEELRRTACEMYSDSDAKTWRDREALL